MVPSRRGGGRAKGDVKEKAETEPGCLHGYSGPPSEGASACCVWPGWGLARGPPPASCVGHSGPGRSGPGAALPPRGWRGGLAPVRFSGAAAQLQTLACTQRRFAPRRPECLGLCPRPCFLFLISTWMGAELWAAESVMVKSDRPLLQKADPGLRLRPLRSARKVLSCVFPSARSRAAPANARFGTPPALSSDARPSRATRTGHRAGHHTRLSAGTRLWRGAAGLQDTRITERCPGNLRQRGALPDSSWELPPRDWLVCTCVLTTNHPENNKRSGPFLRARVPPTQRSSQRAASGPRPPARDGHRLVARAGPVPARVWKAFPWP